jgi:type VI secretion system protein ImpM
MGIIVYGKHPAFGDFLSYGLEQGPLTRLEAWVQPTLQQVRSDVGEHWGEAWDAAPPLRVWIGPDVLGVPLAAVWVPSWDKVGRRYPLIVGVAGHDTAPPIAPDHDEMFYEAMEAELRALEHEALGRGGVRTLIEGIAVPPINGRVPQTPLSGMLWGQRADGDLRRLMQDAHDADATRAQYGRSHWWYPARRSRDAGWLAVNGLPGADALRWLLAEDAAPPDETDENHGKGGQT